MMEKKVLTLLAPFFIVNKETLSLNEKQRGQYAPK